MHIYHWLMKRPVIILALYFLVIVLILWSMTGGDDSSEAKHVDTSKPATTDVDVSSAPKLEPSKLTGDATKADSSEAKDAGTTMADDLKATTDSQLEENSAEELLLMAREAYWNNGLEESEQIYQKLIEQNPDVTDYKGELGNVYWRKGEPKKAAALYAEIALPMIEVGDSARVANMVGFIGFHYPEKATEIHEALEAKK